MLTFLFFSPFTHTQVGFRISPVTLEQHSGMFECLARSRDGSRNSTRMVHISVLTGDSFVPPPHINASMAMHVDIGKDIVLSCSVTVDTGAIVDIK